MNCWDWSGAKECTPCRSRIMLKNDCFVFSCKYLRRYSQERARCRSIKYQVYLYFLCWAQKTGSGVPGRFAVALARIKRRRCASRCFATSAGSSRGRTRAAYVLPRTTRRSDLCCDEFLSSPDELYNHLDTRFSIQNCERSILDCTDAYFRDQILVGVIYNFTEKEIGKGT